MEKLFNIERPKTLSEVCGHKMITQRVGIWCEKDTIPSFILMYGNRGCGKTTTARIIANAANCENPTKDGFCGKCPSCLSAMKGTHPDIIELDAASKNKVEDVKEISEKLSYVPFYKKKVVIFDEVHRLSDAAFSSLLKILEEPPENVIFIFCTTELQKIPDTIKSRARLLTFNALDTNTITSRLEEICKKYDKKYEYDALLLIAKNSGGAMRDAINSLEDFFDEEITLENVISSLGIADYNKVCSLLSSVFKGDYQKSLETFNICMENGTRIQSFVDSCISILIDVIYYLTSKTTEGLEGSDSYKEGVVALSSTTTLPIAAAVIKDFCELRPQNLSELQLQANILSIISNDCTLNALNLKVSELEERLCRLENNQPLAKEKVSPNESGVVMTETVSTAENEIEYVPENFEGSDISTESEDLENIEKPSKDDFVDCDHSLLPEEIRCDGCKFIDTCDGENCQYVGKEETVEVKKEEPAKTSDFDSMFNDFFSGFARQD